jgi:hypothetical protein
MNMSFMGLFSKEVAESVAVKSDALAGPPQRAQTAKAGSFPSAAVHSAALPRLCRKT